MKKEPNQSPEAMSHLSRSVNQHRNSFPTRHHDPNPMKKLSLFVMIITLAGCATIAISSKLTYAPEVRRQSSSSDTTRSEEHTSELQSRDSISYAVFCLKKKFF